MAGKSGRAKNNPLGARSHEILFHKENLKATISTNALDQIHRQGDKEKKKGKKIPNPTLLLHILFSVPTAMLIVKTHKNISSH